MLDEIDKMSAGIQGDPAAALLEVLDPAQNHTFRDHYLEIPLDLSRVLFIATANQLGTIHPALLDRMELITLGGYTEEEKVHIARMYLVPRQRDEHGLKPEQFDITDAALSRAIVRVHPRGWRPLARTANRDDRAQGRQHESRRSRIASSRTSMRRRSTPTSGRRGSARRRRSARHDPAWPPEWPGPRSAATCCSSRPR